MITLEKIKVKALEIGFQDVGITRAKIPMDDQKAYENWLKANSHGDLSYMENKVRIDPELFFPGAKTAIIFVSYYKQQKKPFYTDRGLIASYARGRDYHHLHRKRLKKFISWLEECSGKKEIAKPFSDSSPVMEKALAVSAGLGWFGKNSLLIHRKFGTFILLAGLFTSLEFDQVTLNPRLARCGTCTRCLDACPTNAFSNPYILDAKKCLSYHLIESKKPLALKMQEKNPGYLFGCDICQDVCPHNVRTPLSEDPYFSKNSGLGDSLNLEELFALEKTPEKLFGTPLQRKKLPGLIDNFITLSQAKKGKI